MSEVGISKSGSEKLTQRANRDGKPKLLSSRRKINFARKSLEKDMEYIVDNDVVRLRDISSSVLKRINNLPQVLSFVHKKSQSFKDSARKALLSLDKGQGKVIVTQAFPFRHQSFERPSRPCSPTNNLVLASWIGSDKYESLKDRVSGIYQELSNSLGIEILLGGDLSYICANFGSHPSMSQPCIWCPHYFDKSRLGDHDTIPFEPVLPPKSKNIIRRKTTIWDIDLGKVIFIWRWFN